MKCFSCKNGEMSDAMATYMTEAQNCIVIIKNVPCVKCSQCGEVLYNTNILEKIDEIVQNAERLASGISVINYSKVA